MPELTLTKLRLLTVGKLVLTQREAVTFWKVYTFATMKMTADETLPSIEECAGSLKNVVDALYVLNGKWKLPLILSLMQSSKRFNEIQNEIGGISPKILASELKHLELNGFVTRNVYATVPVTIIYEATDYSRTLRNVLRELSAWGGQHREMLKRNM